MQQKIDYTILEVVSKEIWPLAEVKNYLRVSHDYDDNLIANLIISAVESAELFTGLSLSIRKIRCLVEYSQASLRLKYVPVIEISKVTCLCDHGIQEEITNNFGYTDRANNIIHFNPEHINRAIIVEYQAGYINEIPRNIQHGILMHVAAIYDQKEVSLSNEIKDLYYPYRLLKI
jgi:uncharacterized phiE125 gp8 family phage protein